MKICLVSKYPPIEGGVSSKNYWTMKSIGERGHEIFIVSNGFEVEEEYREKIDNLDKLQPKNVELFSTDPFSDPKHIPYHNRYCEKIASLGVEVVEENNVDVLDSKYFSPYMTSGYLISQFTGTPQILRHAGSDITRIYNSPYIKSLYNKIFNNVDKIITSNNQAGKFLNVGVEKNKISTKVPYFIDTEEFSPEKESEESFFDEPVLTFIGKPSKSKGIYHFLKSVKSIEDIKILLVSGKGAVELKEKMDEDLKERVVFKEFVAPWEIPNILSSSYLVISPEVNFDVNPHSSLIPRESMACGTAPLISSDFLNIFPYNEILEPGKNCFVEDPRNIKKFGEKVKKLLNNPEKVKEVGVKSRKTSKKFENHEKHIGYLINEYKEFL